MTSSTGSRPFEIRRMADLKEAEACARVMSSSEPWITLRRGYEESLAILQKADREVYVAHRDGLFVGFLILNMAGPFAGYVQTLCIVPGMRSQGLGKEMMRFAEARILRESPNVFLCCSSFNRKALRFYESIGYEVIGELKDYLIRGHGEVLLRKTVGPWSGFRQEQ
jgi:[ribosomal protein S18]-alanine N-acetyltransferase